MTLKRSVPLALILLLTAGIFAVSLGNGFVNLDDPLLVTENPHVQQASIANISYVFSHFDPELYIPVTFVTYQLETWTLGPQAWHFHLINLLLHLAAVTLVYAVALRISGRKLVAVVTSALFALHPINAEAVLWISARKDLLSALFALASLKFYLDWRETKRANAYAWSTGLFALALGSKVSVVTLPLFLLFYETCEGRLRQSWKKLVPYFALTLVFGIVAVAGKSVVESKLELFPMIVMAFRSICFYLQQIVAPAELAGQHLIPPQSALHSPLLPLWILVTVAVVAIAYGCRKRLPLVSGGIAFFFLAIAPSFLHYTQGNGTFTLGSERYAYLASAGLFFAIAAGVDAALATISVNVRRFVLAGAIFFLLVLAELTLLRVFVFADPVIFNIDILQKNPGDARAWYNLGQALEDARKPMQAELAFRAALQNQSDFADAAISLGILFDREGRHQEALAMLTKATAIRPDYFKGYFNLGVALQNGKRYPEAEAAYRKTVELFPDYPEAHRNLAVVLGLEKKMKESVAEYEILARIDPGFRAELEALKAGK